ncbi:MAG: transglutaminase-like domain-containing protein [Bacillota bacterium]
MTTRYVRQTKVTEPGSMVSMYHGLPATVSELVKVVQNVFLHVFWAQRYGVTPTDEQKQHVQARLVSRTLEKIIEIDPSPLTVARPLEKRFFGNCRDYSTLMASMLRHQGVPARARCGFGAYFIPDHFEDHWICEYWNGQRWVSVDAQLDDLQRATLKVDFNTLDMPAGKFVNASEAWLRCREGKEDPDKFGIFDMHGIWFVRGNLLRELAALMEAEMLPWDVWGLMKVENDALTAGQNDLLDAVARALVADDAAEIERLYRSHEELRVPAEMIAAGI